MLQKQLKKTSLLQLNNLNEVSGMNKN